MNAFNIVNSYNTISDDSNVLVMFRLILELTNQYNYFFTISDELLLFLVDHSKVPDEHKHFITKDKIIATLFAIASNEYEIEVTLALLFNTTKDEFCRIQDDNDADADPFKMDVDVDVDVDVQAKKLLEDYDYNSEVNTEFIFSIVPPGNGNEYPTYLIDTKHKETFDKYFYKYYDSVLHRLLLHLLPRKFNKDTLIQSLMIQPISLDPIRSGNVNVAYDDPSGFTLYEKEVSVEEIKQKFARAITTLNDSDLRNFLISVNGVASIPSQIQIQPYRNNRRYQYHVCSNTIDFPLHMLELPDDDFHYFLITMSSGDFNTFGGATFNQNQRIPLPIPIPIPVPILIRTILILLSYGIVLQSLQVKKNMQNRKTHIYILVGIVLLTIHITSIVFGLREPYIYGMDAVSFFYILFGVRLYRSGDLLIS